MCEGIKERKKERNKESGGLGNHWQGEKINKKSKGTFLFRCLAEKERKIGSKIIYVHTPAQVVLYKSKSI